MSSSSAQQRICFPHLRSVNQHRFAKAHRVSFTLLRITPAYTLLPRRLRFSHEFPLYTSENLLFLTKKCSTIFYGIVKNAQGEGNVTKMCRIFIKFFH